MDLLFSVAQTELSTQLSELVNSAYRGDSSRKGWTTEADILGGQRTDPRGIEEMIQTPGSVILIARSTKGELVACVHLKKRDAKTAYLGMLTVKPELQAAGLGRKLLERAEEYARAEWSSSTIEMTVISVRNELIAWYERRGYKRTNEREDFPMQDPRFGLPKLEKLEFEVLRKTFAP